jgi:hypothetical protein
MPDLLAKLVPRSPKTRSGICDRCKAAMSD